MFIEKKKVLGNVDNKSQTESNIIVQFPYAFTILLCENFEMEISPAWPLFLWLLPSITHKQ